MVPHDVPIITSYMMAESSQQWTVAEGRDIGKIVRIGELSLNLQLQGFYNVEHPVPVTALVAQIDFIVDRRV